VKAEAIEAAARGVIVPGERITSRGTCWAAQTPPKKPLLLVARRQYLIVLTDRRVLVFHRRRGAASSSDLVIAKRYEAFTLERVARARPLLQVRLRASNGNQFVFEFRPRQRELGGELVARLTPRAPDTTLDDTLDDTTAVTPNPRS